MTEEPVNYNRKLKKVIIDGIMSLGDTFFLHCLPHPDLVIGNRGLTEAEQQGGIVLVFGPYSTQELDWDETFIRCKMLFSEWEFVMIPLECICRIYDKKSHTGMMFETVIEERKEANNPDDNPEMFGL